MMIMKKILCVLLSLLMIVLFASCTQKEKPSNGDEDETLTQEDETSPEEDQTTAPASNARASFILPRIESDALNPYTAKSQINRNFTTLLYDGLYTLDENFTPTSVIAEKADIDSLTVKVYLNDKVRFSNTASLTASDVVYSFNQAKECERYAPLLDNISSAEASERYCVKFTLESPDAYVLNALTFPVIEYGSAEKDVPNGSGRYYLAKDKLTYNKEHVLGKKPKIKNIGLCSLSEKTNFVDSLQIGNISFIFRDLSDCKIQRAVARSIPVTLNNLVYIGINSETAPLNNKAFRQAVNMAIDKDSIVSQDFQGYAVRTESPFNPEWSETRLKDSAFNQADAAQLLEDNGFTYKSETDRFRSDENGRTLKLRILVNEDNDFKSEAAKSIAKNLSQIGIDSEVTSLTFKKYKEWVKEEKFDLYIGEVRLCENMSLKPFFSKGGKANHGIDIKSGIVKSYDEMLENKKSVPVFEKEFSEAVPFIPLCYRKGIVMTSNTLSDNVKSVTVDLFSNIAEWKMN